MKSLHLRTRLKAAIAKAMPDSTRLDVVCSLPKIETWRRKYVGQECPLFVERTELYDYLNSEIVRGPVDYLEFGVYAGESLRHWVTTNKYPESRFYGFDTFTGLPENWKKFNNDMAEGEFDLKGETPKIDDDRVTFVKGLFQDTADEFIAGFNPRSQLVIHNDSDLYSSTLFVLTRFHELLRTGTIVVFDEFSSVLNEFRALEDYCSSYRRRYKVLGATQAYFAQVAIQFE